MLEKLQNALSFTYSCSGGPGGQNVNKVNTKVTLYCNLEECSLSEREKSRIREKSNRLNQDGCLMVSCQIYRSQMRNKEGAIRILIEHLREILKEEKERKTTGIPKKIREQRLQDKRYRALKKVGRKTVGVDGC